MSKKKEKVASHRASQSHSGTATTVASTGQSGRRSLRDNCVDRSFMEKSMQKARELVANGEVHDERSFEAVGKEIARAPTALLDACGEREAPLSSASPSSHRSGRGLGEMSSTGVPISRHIRERYEQALGRDLDGVRVHADHKADRVARSLNAKAFTVGSDIYFRSGTYSESSSEGRELIAHELLHAASRTDVVHRAAALSPDPYEQLLRSKYVALPVTKEDVADSTVRELLDAVDFIAMVRDDLEPAERSIADANLSIINTVLSEKHAAAFAAAYETELPIVIKKNPNALGCIIAAYEGLEALYGEQVVGVLKKQFKIPRNITNILKVLEQHGMALKVGELKCFWKKNEKGKWNQKDITCKQDPEALVLSAVNLAQKGWYFFGMSLHGAFHAVILAVDNTEGAPKMYWMDQKSRGFGDEVTGELLDRFRLWLRKNLESKAKKEGKKITDYETITRTTRIWLLVPTEEVLLTV